jgi:cyclomaltodextrinase / maltogenic alpha-amylase / neopullulanase
MSVPYWVEDAIFNQIFPDRFANGDPSHIDYTTMPWDAMPTAHGFQGGDLRGVMQKIDYLLDLGINAIYFNPIFQATSTHRYNTTDYYRIDARLGDLRDFSSLVAAAHTNGIRIILDGVFNHCGRGFFAFNDLVENQEHSAYRDWFHVHRYPVQAYTPGEAEDYDAWWGYKTLPKLNTSAPAVRQYIMNVARYWIELGIDGWRLDVPNEIDDDDFWAEFRQVVKTANPDAYLLAEIWDGNPRWVGDKKFDGLMNYPFREAIIKWLGGEETAAQFSERVERLIADYPRENVNAMYLTLGTHDTERIWTMLKGDLAKVKMAFLIQFTFPGAPAIYYGDEIGTEGGKDPDSRRTFQWDESQWRTELRQWSQKLIYLRKTIPALRHGDYKKIWLDSPRRGYAFARTLGESWVLVVLNASGTRRTVRMNVSSLGWPEGRIVHSLLESGEYIVTGDELALVIEPWTGLIIS